ncbi:porin [candidate division KSB1 bacterium]|nr:porin [candidate division KSB1 bacterium]
MIRLKTIAFALLLSCGVSPIHAQLAGSDIKVFGYFQASFGYRKDLDGPVENKSFSLQQLNLFLQKELAQRWTIFINFEMVNSFSSFRNWGAHNLEEAWVSYRRNAQFKLKLGLQVPTFNNLNEIKNKTPLLPYIIRPLAYESSFNEIIALEEFAPRQAFVQLYGFIPAKGLKVDYAAFAGNSPNINSDPTRGQTGVDTTKLFLVGGRFGLRTGNFKLGVSATYDHLDFSRTALAQRYPTSSFKKVLRLRLGGDLSLYAGKWMWESEFIRVTYDDDHPELNIDKKFYYGTLGYHFTERLFAYGGYWFIGENALPVDDLDVIAPTVGAAYNFSEAIFLKAQYGPVRFESSAPATAENRADYYYLAISVIF